MFAVYARSRAAATLKGNNSISKWRGSLSRFAQGSRGVCLEVCGRYFAALVQPRGEPTGDFAALRARARAGFSGLKTASRS